MLWEVDEEIEHLRSIFFEKDKKNVFEKAKVMEESKKLSEVTKMTWDAAPRVDQMHGQLQLV